MKLKNYTRTFSFRSGLIFFACLSLTLLSLRVLIYYQSVESAFEDVKLKINTHVEEITQAVFRHGVEYAGNLIEDITDDTLETNDKSLFILYRTKGGSYGNMYQWPSNISAIDSGWDDTRINLSEEGQSIHVYARHMQFPDGNELLVAYRLQRVDDIKRTLVRIMAQDVVLSFALSLLLSWLLVWLLNRHLHRLNIAFGKIMEGNIRYRIPVRGDIDQFDRFGANLNLMLDWIGTLLDTVRDSGNALAHDMRTPLSRHRLELRSLVDDPELPDKLRRKLNRSVADIDHLIEMFDNILNIAKAEARSGTEIFASCDLSELTRDVLDFYEPLFASRDVELKINISDHPVKVVGDKQLLSQAIMNLVDNAVKYGGGHIEVSLSDSKEGIRLTIADDGNGVPAEFRERIKEKFFRLDASRGSDGFGLGLSLVDAVARLHQGNLLLEDNEPGLRATLLLPPHEESSNV